MEFWIPFSILVMMGLLVILIQNAGTKPKDSEVVMWVKGMRRLEFEGKLNTGMCRWVDLNDNEPRICICAHTYHVADPDSMIKAFKWLNGENVEL